MVARPRKAASSTAPEQIVERALKQAEPGMREHQSRVIRMNHAYMVYRGSVNAGTARSRDWRATNKPKYAMPIIDQAVANLAEGIPTARVEPRRPGDEAAAEALEQTLGYFADRDHLAEKEVAVTRNALIYGVSVGKNSWLYEEDAKGNVLEDRPTFQVWDPYDCWWDPMARTVQGAGYIVLRAYLTKEDLLRAQHDPESGAGLYKNLDLLFASGDAPPRQETSAQDTLLAMPVNMRRDHFEVLEYWRKTANGMRLTIVGNRKILLSDGPSPYRMLGYPITISNSRPDDRIEGISETELADDLQKALWDIGNLRLDNLRMTVMRGATIRETVGDMRQFVFQPGFMWPVNDHDDVQMVEMPPLPPEAYHEDEVLLGRLQWSTGTSPYTTGLSAAGGSPSDNTATGTTLLAQGASKLLQIKGQIIHNQTWQRTFEQWADLSRQFLSDGTDIRIAGPGGATGWASYSRDDLDGDFDVKIEASDQSASVQQQRAEFLQFLQVMTPWIQAGVANPRPILEKGAKLFGWLNPQELILPPQAPQQAAPHTTVQLRGDLTPEQEAVAAQMQGYGQAQLPPGQGGSWPQPGQPPQQLGNGQISPQPLSSIVNGNRR